VTEGSEPWHGTWGGYTNRRCRGPKCTEANRLWVAAWRARNALKEPPQHNDNGYTNYQCRCPLCTAAHAKATRERRDRKTKERLGNDGDDL
jgi:hypothetical protein